MPVPRGLVPLALIASTAVIVLCYAGWTGLGVLTVAAPDALSSAASRYLSMLLMTLTICSAMVHLSARIVRAVTGAAQDDSYTAGYADGLDARPGPAVSRIARGRIPDQVR